MTEKKFEIGQSWKTRDGRRAVIGYIEQDDYYPIVAMIGGEVYAFSPKGKHWNGQDSEHDLIEPWTEPKRGEFWVNVYPDEVIAHKSKKEARNNSVTGRLACVHVRWTEGEGL